MARLNSEMLGSLEVAKPTYDRGALRVGIVHFGVGGFHRAHQAMYLDALMNEGKALDWAICGVGVLRHDKRMREVMQEQDCLYTLVIKHPDGELEPRIIGSIVDYLFAPDDPTAVVARMADPATRIVSLTVTEGGYHVHPVTGEFDDRDPDIRHDIEPERAGRQPRTMFGFVTAALRRRRAAGTAAVHGHVLRQHPGQRRRGAQDDQRLRPAAGPGPRRLDRARGRRSPTRWSTASPRPRPTTTAPCSASVSASTTPGPWCASRSPSGCSRTVSPTGRPPFEDVGVQLVDDVEPYELMKLRLLNASHQAHGYFGYLAGYRYAHEVCQDPLFAEFLLGVHGPGGTPTLGPYPASISTPTSTADRAVRQPGGARHPRPALRGELGPHPQVGAAGRSPQPRHGGEVQRSALVVAAWARYAEGVDEQGEPIEVVDRLTERWWPRQRASTTSRWRSSPTATCSATWRRRAVRRHLQRGARLATPRRRPGHAGGPARQVAGAVSRAGRRALSGR